MKKNDLILIAIIVFVGTISALFFAILENRNKELDGIASVYYNNEKILEIYLADGSYTVLDDSRILSIDEEKMEYHVEGSNPYGVVIKYQDNSVGVIDEDSPKHICQYQGFSNSSLSPITCLPNNIVIVVSKNDSELDTIGG